MCPIGYVLKVNPMPGTKPEIEAISTAARLRARNTRDRFGLFTTVDIFQGDRLKASTTCIPGDEKAAARKLKRQLRHEPEQRS